MLVKFYLNLNKGLRITLIFFFLHIFKTKIKSWGAMSFYKLPPGYVLNFKNNLYNNNIT